MTTFIAILLTALTFAFVAYPFFKQKWQQSPDSAKAVRMQELQSKRDTIYSMLKELEFDYHSGILTDDDYRDLEKRYRNKAIPLLKSIDKLEKGDEVENTEDEIEKQVLELRQRKALFCSGCGEKRHEGDRFCSYCGTSLS